VGNNSENVGHVELIPTFLKSKINVFMGFELLNVGSNSEKLSYKYN